MNLKKICSNILVFTLFFFLSIAGISFAEVPGPEFTCENDVECKFTPELQALAASLDHDPVKIFTWVYDNIESPNPWFKDGNSISFIPLYQKSRLGANAAYLAGHGNHWDSSSLLITLLRISGVPARCARYENTDIVWVEAWIKHGNYRNGNGNDSTGQWIPMVPWFKDYHVKPGLDLFTGDQIPGGLDFDFDRYLQTNQPKHAAELYEEQLQAYFSKHHPGQTLDSIAYRETVKKFESSILPPVLPKDMVVDLPVITFTEIPDSDRFNITFNKYDGEGASGYVMLVNGPTSDAYLFNMFNGGWTSPVVKKSPVVVNTATVHNTATNISNTAQQSAASTYNNNNITTAPKDNWVSATKSWIGDPVDMVKGEFYTEEHPDIIIRSRGFNLSVVRSYKNQLIYNGLFGYGWTWNHAERIVPQANGVLLYYDANSNPQTLTHNGDDTYQTAPGITYAVVKEGLEYKVKFRNKTEFIFNENGLLVKKPILFGTFIALLSYG